MAINGSKSRAEEEWICDHPPFSLGPMFDPEHQGSLWPILPEIDFCQRWDDKKWEKYLKAAAKVIQVMYPDQYKQIIEGLRSSIRIMRRECQRINRRVSERRP